VKGRKQATIVEERRVIFTSQEEGKGPLVSTGGRTSRKEREKIEPGASAVGGRSFEGRNH